MFSDFVLFIGPRGGPGRDSSAVLAGLYSGAQVVEGVFEVEEVQVVDILSLHRVGNDF